MTFHDHLKNNVPGYFIQFIKGKRKEEKRRGKRGREGKGEGRREERRDEVSSLGDNEDNDVTAPLLNLPTLNRAAPI